MPTRLHAVYAGRGDSMVVQDDDGTGTTRVYVVDGGPQGVLHGTEGAPFPAYLRDAVTATLRAAHRTSLDGVILSHAHEDHFGGLIPLLRGLGADPPIPLSGPFITQPLDPAVLNRQGGRMVQALLGAMGYTRALAPAEQTGPPFDRFTWSDKVAYTRPAAPPRLALTTWTIDADEDNEASVLMYHPTGLLMTGDTPGWRIPAFLQAIGRARQTLSILKVPHHGSLRNAQRTNVIAKVPAEVAHAYGLLSIATGDPARVGVPGVLRDPGPRMAARRRLLEVYDDAARFSSFRQELEQHYNEVVVAIGRAGAGAVTWPSPPQQVAELWGPLVRQLRRDASQDLRANRPWGRRAAAPGRPRPARAPLGERIPSWFTRFSNVGVLADRYLELLCHAQITEFFTQVPARSYVISADYTYRHPSAETLAGLARAAVSGSRDVRVYVTDGSAVDLDRVSELAPAGWQQRVQIRALTTGSRITLDPTAGGDPESDGVRTTAIEQIVDRGPLHAQLRNAVGPAVSDPPAAPGQHIEVVGTSLYVNLAPPDTPSLSGSAQQFVVEDAWLTGYQRHFDIVYLRRADLPSGQSALRQVRMAGDATTGFTLEVADGQWLSATPPSFLTTDSTAAARVRFAPATAAAAVRRVGATDDPPPPAPPAPSTLEAFCTAAGIPTDPAPSVLALLPALVGPGDAQRALALLKPPTIRRVLGWNADLKSPVTFTRDAHGLLVSAATIALRLGTPATFTLDGDVETISAARLTITRTDAQLDALAEVIAESGLVLRDDAVVRDPSRTRRVTDYLAQLGLPAAGLTVGSLLANVVADGLVAADLLWRAPSALLNAGLATWAIDATQGEVTLGQTIDGTPALVHGSFVATLPANLAPVTVGGMSLTITSARLVVTDARLASMSVAVEGTVTRGATTLQARTVLSEGGGRLELRIPGTATISELSVLMPADPSGTLGTLTVPVLGGALSALSLTAPGLVVEQPVEAGAATRLAELFGTVQTGSWAALVPGGWPPPSESAFTVRVLDPLDPDARAVAVEATLALPVAEKTLGVRVGTWPAGDGTPGGKTLSLWSDPDGGLVTVAEVASLLPLVGRAATALPVVADLLSAVALEEVSLTRSGAVDGTGDWDRAVVRVGLVQRWAPSGLPFAVEAAGVDLTYEANAWSGALKGEFSLGDFLVEGILTLPAPQAPGGLELTTADPDLSVTALARQFELPGLSRVPILGALLGLAVTGVSVGLQPGGALAVGAVGLRLSAGHDALAASLPAWLDVTELAVEVEHDLGTSTTGVALEAQWGDSRVFNLVYDGKSSQFAAAFRSTGSETLSDLLGTLVGTSLANALLPLIGPLQPRDGSLVLDTSDFGIASFAIRLEGKLDETTVAANAIGDLELKYARATQPSGSSTYQLHGTLRGTGTEAAIAIDCAPTDDGGSTVTASITPTGSSGLSLRGLLALFGIAEPRVSKPDRVTQDLFDVQIDAVSAQLSVGESGFTLTELDAAGHAETGLDGLDLLETPRIVLTALGASIHYTPQATTGFMIGQVDVLGVRVTVKYDGDKFTGTVAPGGGARPDYATLLSTPPFATGFGLPSGLDVPPSIPMDRLTVIARPGDFVEVSGAGDTQWRFTVAGQAATITGLGGRLRISKAPAPPGGSSTGTATVAYDAALLGALSLDGFASTTATASFGSDRSTVLTAAATGGGPVSIADLAAKLGSGKTFDDVVPAGEGTGALSTARNAFAYLDLTNDLFALYGTIAGQGPDAPHGSAALLSRKVGDKRGFLFAASLGSGFKLASLWSALSPVDAALSLRSANAAVLSHGGTVAALQADLAVVNAAAAAQGAALPAPFADLPPPAGDELLPGMSLFAELDVRAGTLTRNLGVLTGDPTIVLRALIDDNPEHTEYTAAINNLTFLGGGLTLAGSASYKPASSTSLVVTGGMTVALGKQRYTFDGTFTLGETRAAFGLVQGGAAIEIAAPFGMTGVKLSSAKLLAQYTFGDSPSSQVSVSGDVGFAGLTLTGTVLFDDGAAKVVAVALTQPLSIARFLTQVGPPWPSGFDPVDLQRGTISYADIPDGETITVDSVSYPSGYHVTTAISLFGEPFSVDVAVPKQGHGVKVTGSYDDPAGIDLYLATIKHPALTIDTTVTPAAYDVAFGIDLFRKPFGQMALTYQPNDDPKQRRYTGTATYDGELLGITNPSVGLSYTQAGGLRLEGWPLALDLAKYFDVIKQIEAASKDAESCAALVDLVFTEVVTTTTSPSIKQDTRAASADSLPLVLTGKWSLLVGGETLFSLPLPAIKGEILAPKDFSAEGIIDWLGDLIAKNAAAFAKSVLEDTFNDQRVLQLLAAKLLVDHLKNGVAEGFLCRGVKTEELLDRAFEDAKTPPEPPPSPPSGPTPIASFSAAIAAAAGIIAGLLSFLDAIKRFFDRDANKKRAAAEREKAAQEAKQEAARQRIRDALHLNGQPTAAWQADGDLLVSWTKAVYPTAQGIDYQGYDGFSWVVRVTDEDDRTSDFPATGWTVTVPAATLAASPTAGVQLRAVYSEVQGPLTEAVPTNHVATLPPPATVAATYDGAADAVDVVVATVPHASGYAIDVRVGTAQATTAQQADGTVSFPVAGLPAGLPAGEPITVSARAVGDGTTRTDSPPTVSPGLTTVAPPPFTFTFADQETAVLAYHLPDGAVPRWRLHDEHGAPLFPPAEPSGQSVRFDLRGVADGTTLVCDVRAPAGDAPALWGAPASLAVNRLAPPGALDCVFVPPDRIEVTWTKDPRATAYSVSLLDAGGAAAQADVAVAPTLDGATLSGPAIAGALASGPPASGSSLTVVVQATASGFPPGEASKLGISPSNVDVPFDLVVQYRNGAITATWQNSSLYDGAWADLLKGDATVAHKVVGVNGALPVSFTGSFDVGATYTVAVRARLSRSLSQPVTATVTIPTVRGQAVAAQGGSDPHLFALLATTEWAIGLPNGIWVRAWRQPRDAPLVTLAAQDPPDARLFGLDQQGRVWAIGLPRGVWVPNWPKAAPAPLTQITAQAGSDAHLFGLDANHNLYSICLPSGVWVRNWPSAPPVPLVAIAAQGGDDPHLFGLDTNHNLYAIGLPAGVWVPNWPKRPPVPLVALAAQNSPDPHLFGLDVNHDLWAIGLPGGSWMKDWPSRPPLKLAQISVQSGPDAHLFGIDANTNLWACGVPTGRWVKDWPKPLPRPR